MSGTYPVGTRVIVHGHVIGVRGNDGAVDYRVSTYDNPEGTWFSWVVVDDHTEPAHTIDELRKDVLELRTDLAEEHERAERMAELIDAEHNLESAEDRYNNCFALGLEERTAHEAVKMARARWVEANHAIQPGDLGEEGEP